MKILLVSCVAGVLSNSAIAQAPDLSGERAWQQLDCTMPGTGTSLGCFERGTTGHFIPHSSYSTINWCDESLPPGVQTIENPKPEGDRGTEGHTPSAVTVIRGSR